MMGCGRTDGCGRAETVGRGNGGGEKVGWGRDKVGVGVGRGVACNTGEVTGRVDIMDARGNTGDVAGIMDGCGGGSARTGEAWRRVGDVVNREGGGVLARTVVGDVATRPGRAASPAEAGTVICPNGGNGGRAMDDARGGVVDISTCGNDTGVTGIVIRVGAKATGTVAEPRLDDRISTVGEVGPKSTVGRESGRVMRDPLPATSVNALRGDAGPGRGTDPILGSGGGEGPELEGSVGVRKLVAMFAVRGSRDAAVIRGRPAGSAVCCDIFERGLTTLMGILGRWAIGTECQPGLFVMRNK